MSIWMRWWSVPNRSATRVEYSNSSPDSPPADSKPMLNVLRPVWPASASSATTRLESMPPESSTPTGTSATIRRSTATRSLLQERLLPVAGGPVAAVGVAGELAASSRRCRGWRRPVSMTRTVAGGSLRTPVRIVRGAGTTEWNVM